MKKKHLTGSSYTDREEQHDGIDRTMTLCPWCGSAVGTLSDYCPKCERCLRPDGHKHVEDAYQGLTSRHFANRIGRLVAMCATNDDIESAFERE
jgi:predicted amidophosphoribosyltransferase